MGFVEIISSRIYMLISWHNLTLLATVHSDTQLWTDIWNGTNISSENVKEHKENSRESWKKECWGRRSRWRWRRFTKQAHDVQTRNVRQ